MMDVHKQIDMMGRLDHFQTIKPVCKEIEGFYLLLEVGIVGLFFHRSLGHHGLFVVMALLHHLTVLASQTGL